MRCITYGEKLVDWMSRNKEYQAAGKKLIRSIITQKEEEEGVWGKEYDIGYYEIWEWGSLAASQSNDTTVPRGGYLRQEGGGFSGCKLHTSESTVFLYLAGRCFASLKSKKNILKNQTKRL